MTAKDELLHYLQSGRDALIWKLDGVSEYDARRPLTVTGTNLLGLVKHTAGVEAGYLGDTFGRPFPEPMPWFAPDAEPEADMWATADESRADIVDQYRRVWTHADATIAALDLDAEGSVPWWPAGRQDVTLRVVLVHLIAEVHRHAGHADILRENVDGVVGRSPGNDNLSLPDAAARQAHRDRVEAAARTFRD